MQRNQKIVFIIGGPGSGKGTQCAMLSKKLHYHHISTGELVRAYIAKADTEQDSSELSLAIREATRAGTLLPDNLILDMVKAEMAAHPDAHGFLIDGCPRTMEQALLFEKTIGKQDHTIYLNAPDEELVNRLMARGQIEHREDDNPETIARRLQTYHQKTLPVIEYLKSSSAQHFTEVNALDNMNDINDQIVQAIDGKIISVGLFEFMQLYCSSVSFAETVRKLEDRYHHQDFEVSFASYPLLYVLQNTHSVKSILTANTKTGYQNHNFDVAHGHYLNINATQAFKGSADATHNPFWENIHKGLLKSVGNRELINQLLDKHIHTLFTKKNFVLDQALEKCLLGFWTEYLFGTNVDVAQFSKTRDKLLRTMRYAFYGNSLKNTPVLGELTCRFYGWLKGNEFKEIDDELREYIAKSKGGLLDKMKHALLNSADFPKELVDQAVLDNAFDFVLVFDFINNALYESLASIVKNNIQDGKARRESFAPGLRNAFLFPYRVRVPQQSIMLNEKNIAAGSYVYVNLVKSGLYHSYGPRACVGTGVTQWIKERFFHHLEDIQFNIEATTFPTDRQTPKDADVPMSPERYEVSWNYPKDYLQKHLPDYQFKNVEHFYDVLDAFKNPRLFGYAVAAFVEVIEKLNIDHNQLVIVSPEMRGIPLAAAVARELDAGQVYIRKPGKIPGAVLSQSYKNAYAEERLEISQNANLAGKQVVLLDDGIASGGTTKTCCELIESLGGNVVSILAMINHRYKQKISALEKYADKIHTLFDFEKMGDNSKQALQQISKTF